MTRFVIDRCRCAGLGFDELIRLAREQQLDLAGVGASTRAGRSCKHCRPWLALALERGEARFEVDSDTVRDGEALLRHFQAEPGA